MATASHNGSRDPATEGYDASPAGSSSGDSNRNKPFVGDEFKYTEEKPPLANCEKCFKASSGAIKIIVSIILHLVLLSCLVISKGCLLYITSQLHPSVTFTFATVNTSGAQTCDVQTTCIYSNHTDDYTGDNCQEKDNVRWLWALFLCQCCPYFLMFLACIWQMCFKLDDAPDWRTLLVAITTETLQSIGLFIVLYVVLPFIDVFRGLFLCTAVAIVPCFLQIFNRFDTKKTYQIVLDVLAFVAQLSALIIWPIAYTITDNVDIGPISDLDLCKQVTMATSHGYTYLASKYESITIDDGIDSVPEYELSIYLIPLALIFCSVTWWDNFVDEGTGMDGPIQRLLRMRKKYTANKIKPKLYAIVSVYKIIITFLMLVTYFGTAKFYDGNTITLFKSSNFYSHRCDPYSAGGEFLTDWISVSMIQVCVGVVAFYAASFAIKAHMQMVSFTIPLFSTTPLVLLLLLWACTNCHEAWSLPTDYNYFWNCFQGYDDMGASFDTLITYVGIFWWLSQLWAVRYLVFPRIERLAQLDKIFMRPMHCGVLLEQSLMFIRRRNDEEDITVSNDLREDSTELERAGVDSEVPSGCNPLFGRAKTTPYIYMCATMWHEVRREMIQLLVSILRTDFDSWLKKELDDPDKYEFELNIYFDDAFAKGDGTHHTLNEFVEQFLECYEEAKKLYFKKEWHGKSQPKPNKTVKYVTPYGGQLVFTLPFDSKMVIHLKDKRKIRNRKRWSQVMYMYSLVGQQIKAQKQYSEELRAQVAENSYVLALDGDVDFKPEALTLLLDLMRRDKQVAAACGRIHPIGEGPMVWYQKFEYCMSHWLQKATEHVLGCVLCSPGCFSLFRCSKLVDVIKRYSHLPEGARQHVQFDQGEDRWLCTLLLQQGHRIEYSAASDAYTYAPEEFKEFYNQRRRWITSTYANVMDLLADGRYTANKNDNISMLYIMYQALLFGSSILGPATIFLLIVGAFDAVFQIGLGLAIVIGITPLACFLVVCYKCKEDTQVNFAAILSAVFAVLQTFVLVGLIRQMVTDGICNPQSFFFLFVIGIFVLAAILHPQEGFNLVYIPVYFLLVPCMYLVLIIYSLCNVKSTSWGTRENKTPDPNKDEKAEAKSSTGSWMKYIGMEANRSGQAGYTISCGSCCKLICCGNTDSGVEAMRDLKREILDAMDKSPDDIEAAGYKKEHLLNDYSVNTNRPQPPTIRKQRAQRSHRNKQSDDGETDVTLKETAHDRAAQAKKLRNELENTDWLHHEAIKHWACEDIDKEMEEFWNTFIDNYLKPLGAGKTKEEVQKDTEELGKDLAELRDKVVFGFFLIDILLIVTILGMSLTIQQVPDMAITWNCSVGGEVYESQMDPIGLLFVIVFGFILVIQLIGMLLHRLFTFLQVLSVGFGSSRDDATDYVKKKLMEKATPESKTGPEGNGSQTSVRETSDEPEDSEPQQFDKTLLTTTVADITKTYQFAKLWREKMYENKPKPKPFNNPVAPV